MGLSTEFQIGGGVCPRLLRESTFSAVCPIFTDVSRNFAAKLPDKRWLRRLLARPESVFEGDGHRPGVAGPGIHGLFDHPLCVASLGLACALPLLKPLLLHALVAPGSWLLAPGSWLLAPGSWLSNLNFSPSDIH